MDNKKPFNLLLDLDQTLISAEASEEMDFSKYKDKSKLFKSHDMDGYYMVYSRPYLQEFLDYAFENFNVSIWTAASKDYALFIIEKIVLNKMPNRKLDYIFFSYHCDLSKKTKKYSKELCMLWDIHKIPSFSPENTVIIDDFKSDVHKCQPNNCIIAPPFEFTKEGSENDTFLKDVVSSIDKMKKRMEDGHVEIASIVNEEMGTLKRRKKTA